MKIIINQSAIKVKPAKQAAMTMPDVPFQLFLPFFIAYSQYKNKGPH
ncbi:hypothetical protein ACFPAG_17675 [Vogesella sp. GCM10023246]|uniref:Uncharacterized protein n=1 Tax=Vogesella oryzagri TaxID=3160864 RepID=A0ABV1M886_9NEIS